MKKYSVACILLLSLLFSAFAGDAAVFVDNGFSSDGNVYIFGQYGKIDKTFQGWAEIYTVDVSRNTFVPGEVFKINPSSVTRDKGGKDVYEMLAGRSYFSIKKYNCEKASPEQTLYVCGDEKKAGTDEIVFKDFSISPIEKQGTYHVQLVSAVTGTGNSVSSSFFIMLEKNDESGKVIGRQKIGSPNIVRKSVYSYKIQKIFCNPSGNNIIFVIEKTIKNKTGILIRYMVESAVLDPDLKIIFSDVQSK
jgi:predicted secreted protein